MKVKLLIFLLILTATITFSQTMPVISGETISNKKVNIPGDLKGKYSLLCFASSQKAQADLESWLEPVYIKFIAKTGLMDDMYDLNIFFIPADVQLSSSAVEHRYLNIIDEIKTTIKIPVAVKLNPYFSAMGNMAKRMQDYGADALVLFNRFYQPDFDINKLSLLHNLQYSESNEIRLPLLWIAMLYGRVPVSLAASTGVQSSIEVIKYILAVPISL